jgi:hypothetical protein
LAGKTLFNRHSCVEVTVAYHVTAEAMLKHGTTLAVEN